MNNISKKLGMTLLVTTAIFFLGGSNLWAEDLLSAESGWAYYYNEEGANESFSRITGWYSPGKNFFISKAVDAISYIYPQVINLTDSLGVINEVSYVGVGADGEGLSPADAFIGPASSQINNFWKNINRASAVKKGDSPKDIARVEPVIEAPKEEEVIFVEPVIKDEEVIISEPVNPLEETKKIVRVEPIIEEPKEEVVLVDPVINDSTENVPLSDGAIEYLSGLLGIDKSRVSFIGAQEILPMVGGGSPGIVGISSGVDESIIKLKVGSETTYLVKANRAVIPGADWQNFKIIGEVISNQDSQQLKDGAVSYLSNLLGVEDDQIGFIDAERMALMEDAGVPGIIGHISDITGCQINLEYRGTKYVVQAVQYTYPGAPWRNFRIIGEEIGVLSPEGEKIESIIPGEVAVHNQNIILYTSISDPQLNEAAIAYLSEKLGRERGSIEVINTVNVTLNGLVGATQALVNLRTTDGHVYQIKGSQVVYPGAEWGNFEPQNFTVGTDSQFGTHNSQVTLYNQVSNEELKEAAVEYLTKMLGADKEKIKVINAVGINVNGIVGTDNVLVNLKTSDGKLYQIKGQKVVYPGAEWKFTAQNFSSGEIDPGEDLLEKEARQYLAGKLGVAIDQLEVVEVKAVSPFVGGHPIVGVSKATVILKGPDGKEYTLNASKAVVPDASWGFALEEKKEEEDPLRAGARQYLAEKLGLDADQLEVVEVKAVSPFVGGHPIVGVSKATVILKGPDGKEYTLNASKAVSPEATWGFALEEKKTSDSQKGWIEVIQLKLEETIERLKIFIDQHPGGANDSQKNSLIIIVDHLSATINTIIGQLTNNTNTATGVSNIWNNVTSSQGIWSGVTVNTTNTPTAISAQAFTENSGVNVQVINNTSTAKNLITANPSGNVPINKVFYQNGQAQQYQQKDPQDKAVYSTNQLK